jgi:putative tryptophan/tyrosine transport system substrate-binding protein
MQFVDLRRREFITLVGGAAAWPVAARAQQADRVRRIGFVTSSAESDPETQSWVAAFIKGLEELGWTDGRNVRIDYRFGGGDATLVPKLAKELIELRPEVIVAATTPAATAVRQQTLSIPIVYVQVPDPVAAGFVTNLAHPEGNITGFSVFEFSIGGRWLQVIKECAPGVSRVAVVFDPANPSWAAYLRTIEAAAPSFSMHLAPVGVSNVGEIETNIASFAREPHGALVVLPGAVTILHRGPIIATAARHRLPAVYPYRFFVTNGGLMSYGVDLRVLYKQAASYVDRLLKGAKPADLPVQLPSKFELAVNLKTAKALGLEVPPTLLARADEVIE